MVNLVALAGDNTTYVRRDVKMHTVSMVPIQSEPNHVRECTGFEIPCAPLRQRSRETPSRGGARISVLFTHVQTNAFISTTKLMYEPMHSGVFGSRLTSNK